MEALLLEGYIGIDAFCRALEYKVGKRVSQKVIYRVRVDSGFHVIHSSTQFRNIYPAIIDTFQEFRSELSMNALFGLCRKKSAGVSVRLPLFSHTFFEDQGRVDEFVTKYDSSDRIVDKVHVHAH